VQYDGRHPRKVTFTTIEEDVKRRDLSINALFYDIDREEIVDMVEGLKDIEEHVIRTVGVPSERFAEDRLRILRALRFAARFGWRIGRATMRAIEKDHVLTGFVSPERIRDEFLKGVKSALSVGSFLASINDYGMWKEILPGLDVSSYQVEERDPATLLALLLEDNAPTFVVKKLNELKYTCTEASQTKFLMQFMDLDVENAYAMRRAANAHQITDAQLESYAYERGQPYADMLNAFIKYRLTVSGDDVMAAGFSGAAIGREIQRRETELFRRLVVNERT